MSVPRRVVLVAVLAGLSWAAPWASWAGWLIDGDRFHPSVHGRLACTECHASIAESPRHPDPSQVKDRPTEPFRPKTCAACHPEALEEAQEGFHGGREASPEQLTRCIGCHDPHYMTEANPVAADTPREPDTDRCSRCHEPRAQLPEPSQEDARCAACHWLTGRQPDDAQKVQALCWQCHGDTAGLATTADIDFPLLRRSAWEAGAHAGVACQQCHYQSAGYPHASRPVADCRQCHRPHGEKTAHAPHRSVSCGACHLDAVQPVREAAGGTVTWRKLPPLEGRADRIHAMAGDREEISCRRCHFDGNPLGAAAWVLPAKGWLCMPCHSATLTASDTISRLALVFFLGGLAAVAGIWFSGRLPDRPRNGRPAAGRESPRRVSLQRLAAALVAFVVDGLGQRRLFRASRERWLLHALVFYPFGFRFLWGVIVMAAPDGPLVWTMGDKNHPLTAFLFDFSGMLVLAAAAAMAGRRLFAAARGGRLEGLPPADWPALALLGGNMAVGFLLEGMRMSMTLSPGGAAYAFVGDAVSRLIGARELTGIYGYVWYLHALLTAAFVAYLPFSRMLHAIVAPVALAVNAASGKHR